MINDHMKEIIPKFSGDKRELNLYIMQCEYIQNQYRGDKEQSIYNLHVVLNRLSGDAAAIVNERYDVVNWEQLKDILCQHFSDPRSEKTILSELESMKIYKGEKYLHFYKRIQTVRGKLLSKINLLNEEELRKPKTNMCKEMSLKVFLSNLRGQIFDTVRTVKPQSLEEALEVVLEAEQFLRQYDLHYKIRKQNHSNKNINYNLK